MKQSYKRPRLFADFDSIKEELEVNNLNNLSKLMNAKSDYLLIEKIISFADVTTSRKLRYLTSDKDMKDAFSASNISERVKHNFSFYATYKEMEKWEKDHKSEKLFFCQTKQASIYLPSIFYSFMAVSDPTTRNKPKSNWHGQYKLNNSKINVFLCNDSIEKYFNKELTNKTYQKLERGCYANGLDLKDGDFTPIDLHITPHGIGTTEDGVFAKLRENVFAKDKMIILLEKKSNGHTNVYIAFYRNPKFFILNEIYNKDYILSRYSEEKENTTNQESRKGQAKWRDELAELALGLSAEDEGFVECPFTGVKVQYPSESAFLRASHIKAYAKCKNGKGELKIEEAYDLDNGFLVIADVDALFDKYLISVDPSTKKIVKSKTLSNDVIKHLSLKDTIDNKYISTNKVKYINNHYAEFLKRNSAAI